MCINISKTLVLHTFVQFSDGFFFALGAKKCILNAEFSEILFIICKRLAETLEIAVNVPKAGRKKKQNFIAECEILLVSRKWKSILAKILQITRKSCKSLGSCKNTFFPRFPVTYFARCAFL